MVDFFALGLTHLLMALAVLRLLARADLDADPATPVDPPVRVKKRAPATIASATITPPRRAMIVPGQDADGANAGGGANADGGNAP